MSDYGVLYYTEFYDISELTTHRVELLQLEYSGGETLLSYPDGNNPVTLKHIGDGKDGFETTIIQGQELVFRFYISRDDDSSFDSIFESDYKDYKVCYYKGAALKFEGYLKPENLNKEYSTNPPFIGIELSATDALVDLKEIEFRDENNHLINGRYSLLQYIKYAVAKTGIELDFKIQLNTYETIWMTSSQCVLDKIRANATRFYDISSKVVGIVHGEGLSCWDVIESILKDFNCAFKQYQGYYQITNYHELNSYEYIFDYATLTEQSRAATNNIIDISGYTFRSNIPQQKICPLRAVDIVFSNKDMGGDLTGMDLTDWTNVWTKDFYYWTTDGTAVVLESNKTDSVEESDAIYLTSPFSVTKLTESDYIRVSFAHRLFAVTYEDKVPIIKFRVEIFKPDGEWHTGVVSSCYSGDYVRYVSEMAETFHITETGDYNVRIRFYNASVAWDWETATFNIQDVEINKIVNSLEVTDEESVTFDVNTLQESGKGYAKLEVETILADSEQITELGAFIFNDGGVYRNTRFWATYAHGEQIPLLAIYSRNILNNRYEYKNYLNLTIIDRSNAIEFNNIVTIEGRNYIFMSFERNILMAEVQAELVELLTTQQTYDDLSSRVLDSVNGTNISSSVVNQFVMGNIPDNFLLNNGDEATGSYIFDTDTLIIDSVNHCIGIRTASPEGHSLAINATDGNCLQLIYNDADSGPTVYADLSVTLDGYLSLDTSGGRISVPTDNMYIASGGFSVGNENFAAGVVNVGMGFRIANAAASGAILRGNGTNFVSNGVAALTKTDDTNVTLTLGGTPTEALVTATSLTLGWTGQLSVARGGTGLSGTTTNALLIGATGNTFSFLGFGDLGQVLTSNGNGALPSFQAASTGLWTANVNDIYNNNSGNVGIGTNNPTYKAEINGVLSLINVESDILDLSTSGAVTANYLLVGKDGYWALRQGTNHSINIDVYNTGTEVTPLTILQNGNVGIGSTAPLSKLSINGGLHVGGNSDAGDNNILVDGIVTISGGTVLITVGGDGIKFVGDQTTIIKASPSATGSVTYVLPIADGTAGQSLITDGSGILSWATKGMVYPGAGIPISTGSAWSDSITDSHTNWDTAYTHSQDNSQAHTDYLLNSGNDTTSGTLTATNFILSSDEKLKCNIKSLQIEYLDIDYKEFELKSDKGQKRFGVIAQDIKNKYPELTREDDNGLSVAYIDLMIREIAYLKNKMNELERKIQ